MLWFWIACSTFILPSVWSRILFSVCLSDGLRLLWKSMRVERGGGSCLRWHRQDSTRRDGSGWWRARRKKTEEEKKGGKVFVSSNILWVLEGKFWWASGRCYWIFFKQSLPQLDRSCFKLNYSIRRLMTHLAFIWNVKENKPLFVLFEVQLFH